MLAAPALGLWLQLAAMAADEEALARALDGVDRFVAAQSTLRRDVAVARIGITRDYDDLVHAAAEAGAACDQLIATLQPFPALLGQAGPVVAAVPLQLAAVEEFKTRNAVLRNALAAFGLLGARLDEAGATPDVAVAANNLGLAVMALTLDTSADAVRRARARLDASQAQSDGPPELGRLVRQASLLVRLLPAVDGTIRHIMAEPANTEVAALSGSLLQKQDGARRAARTARAGLGAACTALAGLLAAVGLRLRARTAAQRRRAAFEADLSALSSRLAEAPRAAVPGAVREGLATVAGFFGADAAAVSFGRPDPPPPWFRAPVSTLHAARAALLDGFSSPGLTTVRDCMTLSPGPVRAAVSAAGFRGFARFARPGAGMVALAWVKPPRTAAACDAGLLAAALPLALDAMAQAQARADLAAEQERMERSLQQARRMETLGTFASGIAHNFNNILAAILGHAEMEADRVAVSGGDRHNLQSLRRAARRGQELVSAILAFGRTRPGRRRPVSMHLLLAETGRLLAATWPGAALRLGPGSTESYVTGDGTQLQQVLLNLGTNAIHATDGRGPVCMEVEPLRLEAPLALSHGTVPPGQHLRLRVQDEGVGMDAATLARVFEPFFTARPGGNGLGLATAWEVIRDHGGTWNVESVEGRGSRFEVVLPLVGSTVHAGNRAETLDGAGEGVAVGGHGEAVLILDADLNELRRDEDIVAALGYEPVGFGSMEAVEAGLVDPGRFSAALLIGPPLEKSAAVAAFLHARVPSLPIVLAAPLALAGAGLDALVGAGVRRIISHPIAIAELRVELDGCVRREAGDRPETELGEPLRLPS